jgi:ABC-type Mn2+/Zn2+ transport system permease subunit
MSKYPEPNLTGGIDDALISTATSVPIFPIMLLLFIFGLVFLGGMGNQKRRTGTSDVPFWGIIASTVMTLSALLMTLGKGMINNVTLGIIFSITFLFGIWFFLSKARGEQ